MKTTGLSIVANGVISKYGLSLDVSSGGIHFFYTSDKDYGPHKRPLPSTALVRILNFGAFGDKMDHLYHGVSSLLNFDFAGYGGVRDALVWIDHPKENEMIQKVNELSEQFKKIEIPLEPVRLVDDEGTEIYGNFAEVELWANRFHREFSQYLTRANFLRSKVS